MRQVNSFRYDNELTNFYYVLTINICEFMNMLLEKKNPFEKEEYIDRQTDSFI